MLHSSSRLYEIMLLFFFPAYRFTTCGATGRYGPNQTMCDAAYNNTPVSVKVLNTKNFHGVQVWEVPAEGLYT